MNPARLGLQAIDIHFGTFDFDLHVVVGPAKNLLTYLRWKHDDPNFTVDVSDYRGFFTCKTGCTPIIWLPRRPRTPREHGTLAHEVLHAVRIMLVNWVEMELTRETDEVFCHALSYAVTEILRRIK